jgi:hypothetical protein
LNYGDKEYDPLFPYGFGLTYADENYRDSINIKESYPSKR